MLLERLYDPGLAQTSYLIGCAGAGEAIVIDPIRDTDQYLAAAEALDLRIRHVTETHIHADFVSGARELAARAGATLYLSDEGGADWRYRYAADAGAVLLHHDDEIAVGLVRLRAMHTPGHTPEHLTFLVTDGAAATEPIAAVTGDFVFVGDVGRPDLLERAARRAGTMESAARTLFHSLQRFKALPEWLQIWPGHGAGSACGKDLSAIPHSTIGYERRFNWAFAIDDEDDFVRRVLAGLPEPPRYFGIMKRINQEGPPIRHGAAAPPVLPADRLTSLLAGGAFVVDARSAEAYAAGHLPGTLNIPYTTSFTSWAGSLVPYDRDLYLILADPAAAERPVRELAAIGLDQVAGIFGPEAVAAARGADHPFGTIQRIGAEEVARRLSTGAATVFDVRTRVEWDRGHIPEAKHLPLGELPDRIGTLPQGSPVVVHCQGGGRSAIAASLLRMHGVDQVLNLAGGFNEWSGAGLPVARAEDT